MDLLETSMEEPWRPSWMVTPLHDASFAKQVSVDVCWALDQAFPNNGFFQRALVVCRSPLQPPLSGILFKYCFKSVHDSDPIQLIALGLCQALPREIHMVHLAYYESNMKGASYLRALVEEVRGAVLRTLKLATVDTNVYAINDILRLGVRQTVSWQAIRATKMFGVPSVLPAIPGLSVSSPESTENLDKDSSNGSSIASVTECSTVATRGSSPDMTEVEKEKCPNVSALSLNEWPSLHEKAYNLRSNKKAWQ